MPLALHPAVVPAYPPQESDNDESWVWSEIKAEARRDAVSRAFPLLPPCEQALLLHPPLRSLRRRAPHNPRRSRRRPPRRARPGPPLDRAAVLAASDTGASQEHAVVLAASDTGASQEHAAVLVAPTTASQEQHRHLHRPARLRCRPRRFPRRRRGRDLEDGASVLVDVAARTRPGGRRPGLIFFDKIILLCRVLSAHTGKATIVAHM